ncbi:MAG: MBL fold metallo-hydrolase [Clostridiales bacterium]
MRKSFITKMPDKAGAFLEASKIISTYQGNIVRVSFNKAVDIHTLFLDIAAEEEQLFIITKELKQIGYLHWEEQKQNIILISLKLPDIPGAVKPILEILNRYDINISYMNSQENGSDFQYFKMGLLIEQAAVIKELLDEISQQCDVSIIDYNVSEKILDNTVFYISFANKIRDLLLLSQEQTNEFIINSNKIMQLLDEKNELPHKTFGYISKFATFMVDHRQDQFKAILKKIKISDQVTLHLIQPPCGSNTFILESAEELLFVDSGFACFKEEMRAILQKLFPNFERQKKSLVLTHSDIDHTGLVSLFDTIYVSRNCFENFYLERHHEKNFREQNIHHEPYCRLSRIISQYTPPRLQQLKIIGAKTDRQMITEIGRLCFADLQFKVFEGDGGHIQGETILICDEWRLAFPGSARI